MPLTARQQLTIKHLGESRGIAKVEDVIAWCKDKIKQSRYKNRGKNQKRGRRKHSRAYYQGIIEALQ